ncbi:bacteriocin immunity protein [Streptococcus suis]|uniref:bacteriocin immunity protein n=1 Tax=Streptococcus suis TaxID=1307 RepID=UPI00201AED22|nr:bacteriocin immunity protein [Streptococcus suis]MCL4935465.1 bacteriocin immunity protein [Streptococcus suis]HEL1812581.1 bacteriocin immunity protein [Streptococcus suis]HEL1995719.1 bacteriocin immunity protein [Streptococcus suis]HEL2028189.1 bacteriocin immunity protein [Streptococcus suis]
MKYDEKVVDKIINFILNPEITPEERKIFIQYKEVFTQRPDRELQNIMGLAEELRQLAVSNIHIGISLSPEVGKFYKEISTVGEFERNLGRGLISFGIGGS